jgi:glycosyltransferase involved in cell wall biosynthesis
MKTKIIVRGPALSQSGYGEQTRFALRSLRSREDLFDIHLENVPWGSTNWIFEDNEERKWIDGLIDKVLISTHNKEKIQYDVSLQVTIPNEWQKTAPINIGYTAGIETTMVAPAWLHLGDQMDHIIVVSNHSKQVYEQTTAQVADAQGKIVEDNLRLKTPITVVNFPTRVRTPKIEGLDFKTDFNFLTMAQWGPRKNIDKTIKCFIEEFKNDNVGLVVKANLGKNSKVDKHNTKNRLQQIISKFPNIKCKVYLMHGHLSEEELSGLYQHPKIKAYICMTHGEGYGLPMFEAAYYGLPVLAPVWSGQTDYLCMPTKNKNGKEKLKAMCAKIDYELKPIQKEAVWDGVLDKASSWAFPSHSSYKNKLREVYKDYNRYSSQAGKLKKWVLDNFKAEEKYEEFVSCITATIDSSSETQEQQVMVL